MHGTNMKIVLSLIYFECTFTIQLYRMLDKVKHNKNIKIYHFSSLWYCFHVFPRFTSPFIMPPSTRKKIALGRPIYTHALPQV